MKSLLCVLCLIPALTLSRGSAAVDYGKRIQALGPSIRQVLTGKWTNPVDKVVIEITSIDLASD